MNYSKLLPQVALVFAVVYACTDSTSPGNSRTFLTPRTPVADLGDPPPPPVSTVILVEVQSPGIAVFTGVYFSNGEISDDGGTTIPTFDGTAWLRLDNKQPDVQGFSTAAVSANARFMARDMNFSGSGTLYIDGVAYRITEVDAFVPVEACGADQGVPTPCAVISFRAVDQNGVEHTGEAQAFDRADCLQESKKGDLFFVCEPDEEEPIG